MWDTAGMTGTLIVCALLAAGGYRFSLARNPFRPCHWCNEKGKRRGMVLAHARGYCGGCGGSGWRKRFGTRVLERRK